MENRKKESFVSLLDLIWQRRYYGKPLIHFYRQGKCFESWTYSQLWSAAQTVAEGLRHLPRETPVLISLPNGPEFLAALFACQMEGLWPAPIVSPDIWNRPDYLNYIEQLSARTGIRNIITQGSVAHDLKNFGLTCHSFSDLWKKTVEPRPLQFSERASKGSEIALLQFSSGSTAESKGVLLTHERILKNLSQISEGMAAQSTDSMATWLPLYHDMGLIGGFLGPLFHQAPVSISSPVDFVMDPITWLQHVCDVKATVMVGPDFMYKLLSRKVRQKSFQGDLSCLRICMMGAEPVLASTCKDFIETFERFKLNPQSLMPVYGMAEAVLGVSFFKTKTSFRMQKNLASPVEWVSCGKPLNEVQIQIRNSEGAILTEEKIGEIFISSPSLTVGFFNRPELTAELLPQGWLKTGDLGFLSKEELFITGRTKDLIIVRGVKIHTVDMESRIHEKWKNQIARVAVVAASEDIHNQGLVVALELRSWFKKELSSEEVSKFLKLAWTDIEFKVFRLPQKTLPRTSSGKLKRYKIREWAESGELAHMAQGGPWLSLRHHWQKVGLVYQVLRSKWVSRPQREVPATDVLREDIEDSFRQILNRQGAISFETSFKDFGLDSLKMMELLTEVEKKFGEIPLEKFYEFQNLQDVYLFLKENHALKKDLRPFAPQASL